MFDQLTENDICIGGIKDYFVWLRDFRNDKSIPVGYENNVNFSDEQVKACREFIRDHCVKLKYPSRYMGSYGFKHEVEHHYRCFHNTSIYIPNGSFIIACIREGVPCYRDHSRLSPNAVICLSLSEEAKAREGRSFPIVEGYEIELHSRATEYRRNGHLFEKLPNKFVRDIRTAYEKAQLEILMRSLRSCR